MNLPIAPTFYVLVWAATGWLAVLCLGGWLRGKTRRPPRLFLTGLVAMMLVVLLVPVGGLPGWSRAYSFWTNPSLPLLGLIGVALLHRLAPVRVFRREDWRAAMIFGAVAGLLVYFPSLVGGKFDLYYWGWDSRAAIWGLAGLTVAFLTVGSRMGVLLFGALLAYSIDALESRNCWDYIIDPVYWMISLGWLGVRVVRAGLVRVRRTGAGKSATDLPAAMPGLTAKR